MDDKNQSNIPATPVTHEAPAAGGINFDQLLITNQTPVAVSAKLSDHDTTEVEVPATGQTSDLLSQANAEMKENSEWQAIDISNIAIEEVTREESKNSAQTLGESGIGIAMLWKVRWFNYRKIVSISVFVLVFMSLISGFAFLRKSYLDIASQPKIDPSYQGYIDYAKDYQKLWSEYTNLNDYSLMASTSFLGATATNNVGSVLNSSRLSYLQKKDIFQNGLNGVANDMIANYNALDTLKKDITQYGFFPKDLLSIFPADQEDVSIKSSLMSLEVVKFSAAIKVFSYLDTFIKWLANLLSISSEDAQKKIQALDARGEKDIKTYLNTCYLNPFEIDENCNLVGDFDKYYTYYEKSSKFDISFFKKLMYYIDLKLEQSDLPNFSITFQKFDPKQKEISFNVEVDTFKQDEASLIRQWILNPHVFIVTQLLDLLKQSLFVIGENIDSKQLKIQQKVIQVGSTVFPVNSSSMNFVLPIQKNPQREIADFVLNKDYHFEWTNVQAITTWAAQAISGGITWIANTISTPTGSGQAGDAWAIGLPSVWIVQ